MLQWTQWNREVNLCGDCVYCLRSYPSYCGKHRFTEGEDDLAICPDFERKNMPNIKITAEVGGKQVPLETISTETFEAIKALEKPKEIPVPVARVGNYVGFPSDRRLFLKLTNNIRENIARKDIDVVAINLRNGTVNNMWQDSDEIRKLGLYENVKPL